MEVWSLIYWDIKTKFMKITIFKINKKFAQNLNEKIVKDFNTNFSTK